MGRSIVEKMREPTNRTTQSKTYQIAKTTQKFHDDGDARRHLKVFEQVCEALGERNDLIKYNGCSLDGKAQE